MKAKVTVKEIALEAEVSAGTVSRALRHDPTISPETRVRVQEAARELNYVPLRKRRGLAETTEGGVLQGKRISLLLLGLDPKLEALPNVSMTLRGIARGLADAGATMMMHDIPDAARIPDSIEDEPLDGLIVKAAAQGDVLAEVPRRLLTLLRRLPMVWLNERPRGASWGDAVTTNDKALGRIAARYLAQCGHRHIAALLTKPIHHGFHDLYDSFAEEANALGLKARMILGPEQQPLPQKPVTDVAMVRRMVTDALKGKPRPTALFCAPDSVARLVYRVLAEREMAIPEDVSLMSTCYEPAANAALHPPLTTIDVKPEATGRRAVSQLAWRLSNPSEPHVDVSLLPRLVEGLSVKDLNS